VVALLLGPDDLLALKSVTQIIGTILWGSNYCYHCVVYTPRGILFVTQSLVFPCFLSCSLEFGVFIFTIHSFPSHRAVRYGTLSCFPGVKAEFVYINDR